MDPIYTEQHNGHTIKIFQDEDAPNPRTDFTPFGTMACWHGRYNLGDTQPSESPSDCVDALPKGTEILPLYLYDHSGITIAATPFSCPWDSGPVGYIFITPEEIRKEYSVTRISKKTRERARQVLLAEVETYDRYLRGSVYGFVVEDAEGNYVDSCWGFFCDYDDDHILSEARASCPSRFSRKRHIDDYQASYDYC